MNETPDDLPSCLWCECFDRGFPCRDGEGNLDSSRLIEAYRVIANELDGTPRFNENFWAFDCLETIVSEMPELALKLIVSALTLFEQPEEVAYLAAGPLENLVRIHGERMIEAIEREAARNPRFRFLLSGVWGESDVKPEVWRRIQNAVGEGPWIDDDPRTPQGSKKHSDEE